MTIPRTIEFTYVENERIASVNVRIRIPGKPGGKMQTFFNADFTPDKPDPLGSDLLVLIDQTPVFQLVGPAEIGKIFMIVKLVDCLL